MRDLEEQLEGFIDGWHESGAEEFPTEKDFREFYWDFALGQYDQGRFHDAMIRLVDKGKVGMDGFRYCWPEVAKENRRRCLDDAERAKQKKEKTIEEAGTVYRLREREAS